MCKEIDEALDEIGGKKNPTNKDQFKLLSVMAREIGKLVDFTKKNDIYNGGGDKVRQIVKEELSKTLTPALEAQAEKTQKAIFAKIDKWIKDKAIYILLGILSLYASREKWISVIIGAIG